MTYMHHGIPGSLIAVVLDAGRASPALCHPERSAAVSRGAEGPFVSAWNTATFFSGNTPSTVSLTAGDHTIVVKKKGFQDWERRIKATGGHINIKAELDAAAPEPKPAEAPSTAPAAPPAKDGIQVQVH